MAATEKQKAEPVTRVSADIVAEQIEKLKDVFPEAVSEGKADFDKLRAALGEAVDGRQERYSFTWAGKRDAIQMLQVPSRATLVPVPDESVNFNDTGHIFIEGENLEVLKLLYKSYFGRVKMIYIDPPYNTGNDFIYPDNFTDPLDYYLKLTGQKDASGNLLTTNPETSGRYHSAWLLMMYPRLFFARQLLQDDGVIFVSIDDHEVHNLRALMNEIFGEENFVAQFVWNTEGHTDNQYHVKVNHEYICVYAKSVHSSLGHVVDPNTREESNLWKGFAENSITKNGSGNPPSEVELPKGFPIGTQESICLDSNTPSDEFFEQVKRIGYITRQMTKQFNVTYPIRMDRMNASKGRLLNPCRVFSGWANVEKLCTFIAGGCEPIDEGDSNTLSFSLSPRGVIYYRREREKARNIMSVLRSMGTTEQMRSELERMGIPYQYPKPKELIAYLIRVGTETGGIVMDFFGGSCTTAHSVLELLKEWEGPPLRFFIVQLPEPLDPSKPDQRPGYDFCTESGLPPNIAEIGKERIRRVVNKLKKDEEGKLALNNRESPEDLGFRVFKLTESNYRLWQGTEEVEPETYAKQMAMHADPLVDGWKVEDVIWEVVLKEGFGLGSQIECLAEVKDCAIYRVTDPDRGQSFTISLDDKVELDALKPLGLSSEDLFICRDSAITDEAAANLALQCRLKTI